MKKELAIVLIVFALFSIVQADRKTVWLFTVYKSDEDLRELIGVQISYVVTLKLLCRVFTMNCEKLTILSKYSGTRTLFLQEHWMKFLCGVVSSLLTLALKSCLSHMATKAKYQMMPKFRIKDCLNFRFSNTCSRRMLLKRMTM